MHGFIVGSLLFDAVDFDRGYPAVPNLQRPIERPLAISRCDRRTARLRTYATSNAHVKFKPREVLPPWRSIPLHESMLMHSSTEDRIVARLKEFHNVHGSTQLGDSAALLFADYFRMQWSSLSQQSGFQQLQLPTAMQVPPASPSHVSRDDHTRANEEPGRNWRLASWLCRTDKLRRVRMTYVDGGRALQAYTSLCYPHTRWVSKKQSVVDNMVSALLHGMLSIAA